MAIRSNHYEAAFEAYIRSIGFRAWPSMKRNARFSGTRGSKILTSYCILDVGSTWWSRVKGKRGKNAQGRRPWENWVTTDDLDGLARWQEAFGPGFRAILAFAYAESIPEFGLPVGDGSFAFRGLAYRFWAVGLDDYVAHLRSRGPAWKAVAMARVAFRRRVRPLVRVVTHDSGSPRRPRPIPERDR